LRNKGSDGSLTLRLLQLAISSFLGPTTKFKQTVEPGMPKSPSFWSFEFGFTEVLSPFIVESEMLKTLIITELGQDECGEEKKDTLSCSCPLQFSWADWAEALEGDSGDSTPID